MPEKVVPHKGGSVKPAKDDVHPNPKASEQINGTTHLYAVRTINESEQIRLCKALGVLSPDEEKLSPILSLKTLPDGLYKSILVSRRRSERNYYVCTLVYSTCVVLQVILGAVLTALGASSTAIASGIPITVLAAANTVNAGIIALLHNSGLPGRFRNDWNEFRKVEMHVVELAHSGVLRESAGIAEVIEGCWAMYRDASDTVLGNKPASYIGTPPAATTNENGQ